MPLQNHRLSPRWKPGKSGVSKDSVSTIIHQNLGAPEGHTFPDLPDIRRRVTSVFRSVPKEAITDSFQKLHHLTDVTSRLYIHRNEF
ncbi:hypothetical protein NPIL_379541 [Nephila pilipes]|uniref:Uncharacterized protein n=1 Tax=Nephila pilipes TaxID=299642 RepID=A0A8X6JG46_NEPPI|nr:hypothetical protein NPIL_379541 [Nephila pilipes]